MQSMSLAYFRSHLDTVLVQLDADEICITLDSGTNAVLVSEAHWRSLQETVHLLSSPLNAARLNASIEQAATTTDFSESNEK